MATLRGSQTSYDIGNKPPTVIWTVAQGSMKIIEDVTSV